MVPHAISQAGSEIGPYIGHTLSGSRSPVLFDLAEACQRNRPPTCLLAGSLGSGKTICPGAARLAGVPAGLGADRRHRPQGRSPPRARCPASPGQARDDRALRRRALPRPARPDADRHPGDPRGPHLQLPRLDPAGAGQARVADPAAPGDLRGGGRRCAQLRRGPRPTRRLGQSRRAVEVGRAIEVHGRVGPRQTRSR